jgi:hypothetical protein
MQPELVLPSRGVHGGIVRACGGLRAESA